MVFLAAFTAGLRVRTGLPPRSNSADFGVYEPAFLLFVPRSSRLLSPSLLLPLTASSTFSLPLQTLRLSSAPGFRPGSGILVRLRRPARRKHPLPPLWLLPRGVNLTTSSASGGRSLADTSVPLVVVLQLADLTRTYNWSPCRMLRPLTNLAPFHGRDTQHGACRDSAFVFTPIVGGWPHGRRDVDDWRIFRVESPRIPFGGCPLD